jgi:hypothetical protein
MSLTISDITLPVRAIYWVTRSPYFDKSLLLVCSSHAGIQQGVEEHGSDA